MTYVYNEKDANISSVMPEGDYEVRVDSIERKTLPSGKEKLAIRFRVRNDVEQPYKNKIIFEDIWQERENPQYFNRKRINQLLGTQHIDDGHVFEDINDVITYLQGSDLIVHITVELNEYKGEDVNVVQFYKSTKCPLETLEMEEPKINIADDEIPF